MRTTVRLRALAAIALATGAVFVATSCRQLVGVEDRALASCGSLASSSPSCADCVRVSCCAEASACRGDPACAKRTECVAKCGDDDGCVADCEQSDPLSRAAIDLFACEAQSCTEVCGLGCGDTVASHCDPCQIGCCRERLACTKSSACGELRLCEQGCGKAAPDCHARCQEDHPEGADLARSIVECLDRACDTAADWSCLGATRWPTGDGSPLDLVVAMFGSTSAPLSNLRARACSISDLACSTPLASATTDVNGFATLALSPQPGGVFTGFVAIDQPEPSIDPLYPVLVALMPPASASQQIGVEVDPRKDVVASYAAVGVELDPALAIVALTVIDCAGRPAAHVHVEISSATAATRVLYPTPTAPGVDATETSELGAVTFVNVSPGIASLTARLVPLCATIANVSIPVVAGTGTLTRLPPSPESTAP